MRGQSFEEPSLFVPPQGAGVSGINSWKKRIFGADLNHVLPPDFHGDEQSRSLCRAGGLLTGHKENDGLFVTVPAFGQSLAFGNPLTSPDYLRDYEGRFYPAHSGSTAHSMGIRLPIERELLRRGGNTLFRSVNE